MTELRFEPRARVIAVAADGTPLDRRAVGHESRGHVWICREEEWEAALREWRTAFGVPWPMVYVQRANA